MSCDEKEQSNLQMFRNVNTCVQRTCTHNIQIWSRAKQQKDKRWISSETSTATEKSITIARRKGGNWNSDFQHRLNAWMARKFLNSGARLAVMAQRAGCTAFNPWHDGLPCSVWKHQLWFSNLDLLWRSIQPGCCSTRRTDTHWWEFYMVVWCSSR